MLSGYDYDCACPMDCHSRVNDISMTSAKLKCDSNLMDVLFENGMPLKELEDQLKTIEEHKDHPDYEIPQRLYNDILHSSSIVHVELPDIDVVKVDVTHDGIHEILYSKHS